MAKKTTGPYSLTCSPRSCSDLRQKLLDQMNPPPWNIEMPLLRNCASRCSRLAEKSTQIPCLGGSRSRIGLCSHRTCYSPRRAQSILRRTKSLAAMRCAHCTLRVLNLGVQASPGASIHAALGIAGLEIAISCASQGMRCRVDRREQSGTDQDSLRRLSWVWPWCWHWRISSSQFTNNRGQTTLYSGVVPPRSLASACVRTALNLGVQAAPGASIHAAPGIRSLKHQVQHPR